MTADAAAAVVAVAVVVLVEAMPGHQAGQSSLKTIDYFLEIALIF